jgi:hypothetical protein
MFTTSNLFYVSSPWIVLLSGAMTYALSFFSDHIYQSLQLFALSFGLGILFQLLTLAATPFAVVRLLRAGVPHLRRIDIVARVNRTDWNAIAQSGQRVASSVGTGALRILDQLKIALHALRRLGSALLQRIDWSQVRRKSFWILANIVVTLLPVFLLFFVVLAHANLLSTRNQSPLMLSLAITSAAPFVFIAIVGLKTRFDMLRIFSFTPTFLRGLRIKIMISGPVLAAISIAFMLMNMSPLDRGWMILLGPIYAVAITLHTTVIGLLLLIIEMITKRYQTPPPPSNKQSRWLKDPIWVEDL